MKKILIVSQYPNIENLKDGMIRRISEIDKLLSNYDKTYLDISFKRKKNQGILKRKSLHPLYNLIDIIKIIKNSDKIYCHSLFNFIKIFPIIIFFRREIILDYHGTVPEEQSFLGNKFQSKIMNLIEWIMMIKIKKSIFVTNKMKNFYFEKYNYRKKLENSLIFPIVDTTIREKIEIKKLNYLKDKVVFIYSGGLAKWQNISLMLDIISNAQNENYFYIFLTGQKKEMSELLISKKINPNIYLLETVEPEELGNYYEIANYGFILRDDHILNRVANPTKLGEYLEYGIIPIVKLEELGDYKEMGYEYLKLEEFNNNLMKKKSLKNIKLMTDYKKRHLKSDFLKFIES